MKVDNFNKLSEYFDILKDKEDFFYIQIIQRKKDGNVKSECVIRNFYVYNKEYFFKRKELIQQLCQQYNARAYFWINPRNARKITLECIKSYADMLTQNNCCKGYKLWDKKCGAHASSDYNHLWLVDVDSKDQKLLDQVVAMVNKCRGNEENKIKDIVQTANGYHILTTKFDTHYFQQLCRIDNIPLIDIHKDNPTLLYYEKDERTDM
jgi:hypothetical protein